MNTRFELHADDRGRVSFSLVGSDGEVLLQGLPCASKIAAQTELLHARKSLQDRDRLIAKQNDAGKHFVVLKDSDGSVLARSRQVPDSGDLEELVGEICSGGVGAAIIDQTPRVARR